MEGDPEAERLLAHLDTVLVGGIERRPVHVVDWRPDWRARFAIEQERIALALGDVALRIEHVGSTAVKDLAAKPIVDISVAVADADDEAAFAPALGRRGYEMRVREPGHRMFRTPGRDVHVHVWPTGSEEERRQLLFRDWLRRSADDRRLYEETKRELARREWPDMNLYAEAKTPVVADIMCRAEEWAASSGWDPT